MGLARTPTHPYGTKSLFSLFIFLTASLRAMIFFSLGMNSSLKTNIQSWEQITFESNISADNLNKSVENILFGRGLHIVLYHFARALKGFTTPMSPVNHRGHWNADRRDTISILKFTCGLLEFTRGHLEFTCSLSKKVYCRIFIKKMSLRVHKSQHFGKLLKKSVEMQILLHFLKLEKTDIMLQTLL